MKHFGEFAASLSLSKAQSESAKQYQFLCQKGGLGDTGGETSLCSCAYSIWFNHLSCSSWFWPWNDGVVVLDTSWKTGCGDTHVQWGFPWLVSSPTPEKCTLWWTNYSNGKTIFHGKIPTISMAIFHSFLYVHQRVTQVSLGRVRVWPQERVRCLLADVSGSSTVELQAPDATVTGSKYLAPFLVMLGMVGYGWSLDNDNIMIMTKN